MAVKTEYPLLAKVKRVMMRFAGKPDIVDYGSSNMPLKGGVRMKWSPPPIATAEILRDAVIEGCGLEFDEVQVIRYGAVRPAGVKVCIAVGGLRHMTASGYLCLRVYE